MTDFQVVATITPHEGKFEVVKGLLNDLAIKVKEHEPNTLRYIVLEQINARNGVPVIIVVEAYKSKEDFDEHKKTVWAKALFDLLKKEPLIKETSVVQARSFAGFTSRL